MDWTPEGGWPNRQLPPPSTGEAKGCLWFLLVAAVLTVAVLCCCGVVL